jgi:hypothetical protein
MANCLACHGEKGSGKPNDPLVGGIGSLAGDQPPVKTVGSFWPYATTLLRRAMPLNASKSHSNDEVYAVAADILRLNGIIGDSDTINAQITPGKNAEPRRLHLVLSLEIAVALMACAVNRGSTSTRPMRGVDGAANGVVVESLEIKEDAVRRDPSRR